ncbi:MULTISPECIES: hypothetical protein, partial [unclassified Rhizobium]|uniref:hypothetical protein n=1 Tax=unclassified Rhizobium TaxID=2613769 RepID=UPI001C837BAC
GGDQTLARPGIRKNVDLPFHDPSPIAGEGWPSSPALLYLNKKRGNHKTSHFLFPQSQNHSSSG